MEEIKKGKNRFYIEDSERLLAEITFVPRGKDILVADHTYVCNDMRGQGVAKKLVDVLVEHACSEDKKILAQCPYVKRFTNDEKYKDNFVK